ncbi:hypothetical protein, partial [Mycoplasma sp. Z386]
MKIKFKNVLLTLGTSATALAGFAFAVSCEKKEEAKKPETPSTPTNPGESGSGAETTTPPVAKEDGNTQSGSGEQKGAETTTPPVAKEDGNTQS